MHEATDTSIRPSEPASGASETFTASKVWNLLDLEAVSRGGASSQAAKDQDRVMAEIRYKEREDWSGGDE